MSEITPIGADFGLLGTPPDYVGNYMNAFAAGRKMAGQQIAGNAMTADPPAGASLADRIAGMSDEARASAARQAEILGAVAAGLKGHPYTERRALLTHLAPALAARGLPPQAIDAFDPTDDNLDATAASAQALGGMLAQA